MASRSPRRDRRALERQAGKCPSPPYKRRESGAGWVKVASRCRKRTCRSCGVLWAGDTRKKLLVNVDAYAGDVSLVTVTAPGAADLPWAFDEHGELVEPKRVQRPAAKAWNRQAKKSWQKLQRKASQRARRLLHRMQRDGLVAEDARWGVVATSWAFQRRGVLHLHLILPMATSWERMCSQLYAETLDEMSHAHGFGFVDCGRKTRAGATWKRALEVIPRQRASRYVAKYIAKADESGRLELSETVDHPDCKGHVAYCSRRLTRETGCTMAALRLRRHAWVVEQRCEARGIDCGAILLAMDRPWTDREIVSVFGSVGRRGP